MTAYTSFVAIDSLKRAEGHKTQTVKQPLPLPEGVSNLAVGGKRARMVGNRGVMHLQGRGVLGGLQGKSGGFGGLGTTGRGAGGGGTSYGYGTVDLKEKSGKPASLPRIRAARMKVMGSLDRSGIQRVIRRQMSGVRRCYEKQLTKNPNLAGKIVVKFTIDKNGTVKNASIQLDTVGSRELSKCILKLVRKWRFPKGSGKVEVSYPFIFASAG
jgi:TonB family protein